VEEAEADAEKRAEAPKNSDRGCAMTVPSYQQPRCPARLQRFAKG